MDNVVTKAWQEKKFLAELGGSQKDIEKQVKCGKKTARQRIDALLDSGTFEETDQLVVSPFLEKKTPTDGVITGFGKIQGQTVAIYSQDFTIKGGSLGLQHAKKICKVMDLAVKIGCPIIGIIDSGGARIDEGIHALGGYGEIFIRNARYSGIVPQLSLILGPCAGGAVYSPALTDFIFTTESISQLFITGPQVIQQVTGEEISKEELGGASIHARKSGVVHFVSSTEEKCFETVKKLLSYLPNNYLSEPPKENQTYHLDKFSAATLDTDLQDLVPQQSQRGYNIIDVIHRIVDHESFFEIQKEFAQNIVIGFARMNGTVTGVVANQPQILAGSLDIDASCKAARFINFCNSFSIPILSLVDVPGFLPGIDQEHNGIIRHGAKLLAAYANATVPKITVIIRKAFGGAYVVMGSKHLGADFVYAWPTAEIAVLGAKAAIAILGRSTIANTQNQDEKEAITNKLEQDYTTTHLNPFLAAEYGYIDAIIPPNDTRTHLIRAFEITKEKVEVLPKKKLSNLPL